MASLLAIKKCSLSELEQVNYRVLQKHCKTLCLPANLKKCYLANLLYTKFNGSNGELESIINKAKSERLLAAEARKKNRGKVTKKYASTRIKYPNPALTLTPTRKTPIQPRILNMQLPDRVLRYPRSSYNNQIISKRSVNAKKVKNIELSTRGLKCIGFLQPNTIRRTPLPQLREQLKTLQPIILANRNVMQIQCKNKTTTFEIQLKPKTSNSNASPKRMVKSNITTKFTTKKTTVLPDTIQRTHIQRGTDNNRSLLNGNWNTFRSLVQRDNVTRYTNTNTNGYEDSNISDDETDSNVTSNTNMDNYPNLRTTTQASDDNFFPNPCPKIHNKRTLINNTNPNVVPNTNMNNYPNLRAATQASDDYKFLPPLYPRIHNVRTLIGNTNPNVAPNTNMDNYPNLRAATQASDDNFFPNPCPKIHNKRTLINNTNPNVAPNTNMDNYPNLRAATQASDDYNFFAPPYRRVHNERTLINNTNPNVAPNTNMDNYPNLRAANRASDDYNFFAPQYRRIHNERTLINNTNPNVASSSDARQYTPVRPPATCGDGGSVLTPVTTRSVISAPFWKGNTPELSALYTFKTVDSTVRSTISLWTMAKSITGSVYTGSFTSYVLPTYSEPLGSTVWPGFYNTSQMSISQVTSIVEVDDNDMDSALEIIRGDGDYVSRLGMNFKVECVFCCWEAQKILLDNHLRKRHAEIVKKQNNDEWVISFNLEQLMNKSDWLPLLVEDPSGLLYIVSGKLETGDCILFAIATVDAEQGNKDYSITAYNKKTTDAVVWGGGKVHDYSAVHSHAADNLKIELSRLDIVPDVMILNRLMICSPSSPIADAVVDIVLYVKLSQ